MISQIVLSLPLQCLCELWKCDLYCADRKQVHREMRGQDLLLWHSKSVEDLGREEEFLSP